MTTEKTYEIAYSFSMPDTGTVEVAAIDENDAKEGFDAYIQDILPDALDVQIVSLKEV